MDKAYKALPMVMTVAAWTWDAYAQAHGIPYKVGDAWMGFMLMPYAKWSINKGTEGGKKLIGMIKKPKEEKKEDELP